MNVERVRRAARRAADAAVEAALGRSRTRLTRRGWAVLAAVIGAVASGALFGARGLNAVAAPGAVALAAAAVQVARTEAPSVDRELPEVAERGDLVAVRLRVDVAAPFSARLLDHLDAGLYAEDNERETTLGDGPLDYRIRCLDRGRRRVGPTLIEARDVLGLLARRFPLDNVDALTVRPRVYPLTGPRREELLEVHGGESRDRQEFEHLRDYERGDSLRDVHWKSSAKQPDDDLVVKELSADEELQIVEVGAEATPGNEDAMADAAASVVVDLLAARFRVGLVTAREEIPPGADAAHRDRLLDHLAESEGGPLRPEQRADADVLIHATDEGTRVDIGGRRIPFEELARIAGGDGEEEEEEERTEVAAP